MIPKEILKKVREIEFYTNRLVSDSLAGEYHSVFKGRGMEFSEVREYQPGDDIRLIDWNVTARMGHPYVKLHVEERELTVIFLVDASASGSFGTVDQMKGELAVELCAVLAFSAIRNNDKVGLITFTDDVEKYIPAKKGRNHVLRVIRELLYFKPQRAGTNIQSALDYLNKVITRKAVIFLVSDFMDDSYEQALRVTSRKHDVIPISITDPREEELPSVGLLDLEDAESGERLLVDSFDPKVRDAYKAIARREAAKRDRLFRSMKLDRIELRTDRPYMQTLIAFFRRRAKRY
ncbi:DUF58 domain-containing protein [candidate division KSB3 bacterium]|uniref:DUF58 domain-containing protein n=1 Tax=candidate division KSB3 bacterium TaxID=2044937 RepID=A0A2G6E929_9BACT|nr:MAG: DUF58 domain-containing protein [candidate division KSB3 bacterium]PIE29537.1 MAG: DUF58 domain-containing protein [candidate division KSB3 bacterium]